MSKANRFFKFPVNKTIIVCETNDCPENADFSRGTLSNLKFSNEKNNFRSGFSLVEMIVVVAIMAVLVVVLAPALLQYNERSRAEKDNSSMDEVVNAVQLALADPDVYDEVLRFSTVDNISCYVDTNSEANYQRVVTKANPEGVDQYTFLSDARQLDETPYFAAGNMRGVTITFAPNKGSNGSIYDLKQGVVNQYIQVSDNQRVGAMTELYNQLRSVVGDEIFNNSQTYRNSEYTIFIRLGTTGGNDAAKQDSIQTYGQWSGTNLPAAVSYQLVQDRTVGDTGNAITDIKDNKWNAENGNKVTINPGDLNGGGLFDSSTIDGNQQEIGNIYAYLITNNTLVLRDSEKIDKSDVVKEYGPLPSDNSSNWATDRNIIEYVNFETKIYPTSMFCWFDEHSNLKKIYNIENLDTRNVTRMDQAFSNCIKLEELNVSHFDTSNVTNMTCTFEHLYKIPYLDVSNFDVRKVTRFNGTFAGLHNIETLNVSGFQTDALTDMGNIFSGCQKIKYLDLSNWDTSKVRNMEGIFQNCYALENINFGTWESQMAYTMVETFDNCKSLTKLNLSDWETENVEDMYAMFSHCENLKELNVENFNTSKVKNFNNMFGNCHKLESINLSNFDTTKAKDMRYFLVHCHSLKEINVSNFDTSNVTVMLDMFAYCYEVEEIILDNWETQNVENMQGMFHECYKLKEIDVSSFDTSKAINMKYIFQRCRSLTVLDVSNFEIQQADELDGMFNECVQLTTLIGVDDWEPKSSATTLNLFNACKSQIIPSWYA